MNSFIKFFKSFGESSRRNYNKIESYDGVLNPLPSELINHIFIYLDLREIFYGMLLSKAIYRSLKTDSFWYQLNQIYGFKRKKRRLSYYKNFKLNYYYIDEKSGEIMRKNLEIPKEQSSIEEIFGDEYFCDYWRFFTKFGYLKIGKTKKKIAVKEINKNNYFPVTFAKMMKEFSFSSKELIDKYLLRYVGYWKEGDKYSLCVEFHPDNLSNFVRDNNFTPLEKIQLLLQIARGLKKLHSEKIVHSELSSQFIIMSLENDEICVKISNCMADLAKSSGLSTRKPLPYHISPECFFGIKAKNEFVKDIFSLGVIMWEVWVGSKPYKSIIGEDRKIQNVFLLLERIHGDVYNDESTVRIRPNMKAEKLKDCPKDLRDLMCSCWEHDHNLRPQSVDDVIGELEYHISEITKKNSEKKKGE